MITIAPTYHNLATLERLATVESFPTEKSLISNVNVCCVGSNCTIPMPVFADLENPTSGRNNDYTRFVFELNTGNTIETKLINLTTGDEIEITNSDYGILVELGDIVSRPLVYCFVIKWLNVADEIGFYDFQLNFKIYDSSSNLLKEISSPCYNLKPFNCATSNRTIRIETFSEGYNQSGFDWRGIFGIFNLIKFNQIRLYGTIEKTPITLTDYIVDGNLSDSHVQTRINHEYDLRLHFLTGDVYDSMIHEHLLNGVLTINSYNVHDSSVIDNLKCSYVSVDKKEKIHNDKKESIIVKLTDNVKNNLKRY